MAKSTPTAAEALARSAMYGILAHALAFPAPDRRAAIRELADALPALPSPIAGRAEALAMTMPDVEALQAEYARLLTHSTSKDVPCYETAYTATETFQQSRQMADIGGFYTAFGVQPAAGGERIDHITTELGFMHYLVLKEAYARGRLGAARVSQARRAQRLFLRDHLGRWAPSLGNRLHTLDPESWMGRAGGLLVAWLEKECRELGTTPAPVEGTPTLPPPEPDHEGPAYDAGDELEEAGGMLSLGGMPLPMLQELR